MFTKIFGGIAAVSVIAALLFWGLWNSEKVKSAEILKRLTLSIENTQTLKDELKDNSDQMVKLIELQSKNMDMINAQISKNDKIDAEKNTALAENRQMRANEAFKALQKPFERGNAASDRVTKLMRGIAGRGPDRDGENTDSPEANNTQ